MCIAVLFHILLILQPNNKKKEMLNNEKFNTFALWLSVILEALVFVLNIIPIFLTPIDLMEHLEHMDRYG